MIPGEFFYYFCFIAFYIFNLSVVVAVLAYKTTEFFPFSASQEIAALQTQVLFFADQLVSHSFFFKYCNYALVGNRLIKNIR